MYKLAVHEDAVGDLRGLPPTAAAFVVAFLQQLKADQIRLASLLDHGGDFGAQGGSSYNVSKWQQHWVANVDLWRVKFRNVVSPTHNYRVIYAYEFRTLTFHILAVVHRDFGYDDLHPTTQRILARYKELVG